MSEAIIVAIIVAITNIITSRYAYGKRKDEDEVREAKRQQQQEDRDDYFDEKLEEIDKKLDEHNGYAKKFGKIEISLTKLQKDVEYLRKEYQK